MSDTITWDDAPQGSEPWLALRARGFITGSKAKDARAKKASGEPKSEFWTYAYDTARQREGGVPLAPGQNTAMRMGQEQEPIARMKYEARTGEMVEEVGFAYTTDGKFGCSVDGLVGSDGAVEIKTMVGSTTLFDALIGGDISDYRDQCLFAMWLLRLQWVDVVLWAPDLDILRVIRVNRDEAEIEKFEADMLAFDRMVESLRGKLRSIRAEWGTDPADPPEPAASVHVDTSTPESTPAPAVQAVAPDALPELF